VSEIVLPEQDPTPTLEAQLDRAVYAAMAYHQITSIVRGSQRVYIVPRWMYEKIILADPTAAVGSKRLAIRDQRYTLPGVPGEWMIAGMATENGGETGEVTLQLRRVEGT
jgi:hypothetical protein